MSRILIWRQIIAGSDIDIFSKTDYTQLDNNIKRLYNGRCPNWGNKLWFQGIYSEIESPENHITIRTNESISEINESFDLIIYPMANFFSEEYAINTENHVETFKQIKIPVYVIACGAQAKHYGDIEALIKKIGDPSSRFIEAIYKTGGEFALRGYFTKEFFDRLGFSNAVVTGCPSIFQMGPDLQISTQKKSVDNLLALFTGKIEYFERIMSSLTNSIYISQELYEDCLYKASYFMNRTLKQDLQFLTNNSITQAELLGEGRIKMIVDLNDWYQYIKSNSFDFSFGTKLHGSIMAILAGTPTMMMAIDSRTREVAEYFDIPFMDDIGKKLSIEDYNEAYDRMDYTKFNSGFKDKYQRFDKFLIDHKIVKKINDSNRFFSSPGENAFDQYCPNQEMFKQYAKRLKRKQFLIRPYAFARQVRKMMKW